jgi:hypothetical protein
MKAKVRATRPRVQRHARDALASGWATFGMANVAHAGVRILERAFAGL